MEFFIILVLVLVNGIFAMSEMSLVSSKKFKLENAKKKGVHGAKAALELSEHPSKFLSTVQIGITLIGILLGVYSGENLTRDFEVFLDQFPAIAPYSHNIAVALIVVFITYVSIVLGELLPKRIGMAFPEPIAIMFAKPMKFLSVLTSPFVWLLSFSNEFLLKVLGLKNLGDSKVSEEEIKSIIKESVQDGEIDQIEHHIVERVFELGDRRVNSLFTHKSDIIFFNEADSLETVFTKVAKEKHSAYPVCANNNIDIVKGIVLLKDLVGLTPNPEFKLSDYCKKPLFITEGAFAYNVLEMFKKEKIHYGIVIDEYGSTKGIVTMDDVVDALIGDVSEFNQEEYAITPRNENSWLADGQYPLAEFYKYFEIEPEEDYNGKFVTIAGLFIHKFSALPKLGDKIRFADLEFEVVDKDGQRIDKILINRLS